MDNIRSRLSQYKLLNLKIERLQKEYEEASEDRDCISINYDGMPHGTDISSKTENLAIRLADLDLEIKTLLFDAFVLKKQIIVDIEHIKLNTPEKTEMAKTILKMRYIDTNENDPRSKYRPTRWEEIYKEFSYYGESTLRLYEREGLNELERQTHSEILG